MDHRPARSVIIWFSQRTGSTLLSAALAGTGVAGQPEEWLNEQDPAPFTLADLQAIWQRGTSPNGVFGLKYGPRQDSFAAWTESFRRVQRLPASLTVPEVWAATFPDSRHLFMTRRNKARLAVSWWRAIQSGEWHRAHGQAPLAADLDGTYNFEAIRHLFTEASLREALIEDFFDAAGIQPLTVVYEDFIRAYDGTVRALLETLGAPDLVVPPPAFGRLADEQSEAWVQRFRRDVQAGWTPAAW